MFRMWSSRSYRLNKCNTLPSPVPPTPGRAGSCRRFASQGVGPPPPPSPPAGGGAGGGAGGAGGSPRNPKPWWLLAAQIGAGVVSAAGVAAAALPSILSTQWGLQRAMELINTRMPGRVEVAQAQLSWLGGNELQCVKVYDSPRGGQILMHLNKVSASATLWGLLCGSGDFNVVIAKPWINTVYDARISDFKLINFLEKVGLLSSPEPPPPLPSSPKLQQLLRKQQGPGLGQGQDPPLESPPETAPNGNKPEVSQKQQQPQQQPGRLVEVLSRINSKMDINADVRLGRMNLVVTDGMLLVAEEMRQILGPKVHITGAIGNRELREWAEEVGEDVDWAIRSRTAQQPAVAAAGASPPAHPSPVPPAAVLQQPHAYRPGIVQVHSDHLTGEMRVWKAEDHMLLHQPATARLDLTPALSRLGLGTANPLLANVVEVRGGERLVASFYPAGGRLPYQEATVEMAPATLALGPASMAVQLLDELGLKTLSGALSRPVRSETAAAAAATATAPAGSLYASLSPMLVTFSRAGLMHTDRVDMWLRRPGRPNEDLDGGSGPGQDGVRLAVWGGADLQTDRLDFTLGVAPGPLLEAVGLGAEGLPEGYLLLVPLRGSASAPMYDVRTALLRLGQLGARQKAAQWVERQERRREGSRSLVGGLEAVISAVKPPGEVVAAVDRVLQEELDRTPPAPPGAY